MGFFSHLNPFNAARDLVRDAPHSLNPKDALMSAAHAANRMRDAFDPDNEANPLHRFAEILEPEPLRDARQRVEDKLTDLRLQLVRNDPLLIAALDKFADGGQWSRPEPASTDGAIIGAYGEEAAGVPLRDVPAVLPADGRPTNHTIVYVNGAGTDEAAQRREMQLIANQTGCAVVGVHNRTEGVRRDLQQLLDDESGGASDNPAVHALSDVVYAELTAGRPVSLMGASQGASIIAAALRDVEARLHAAGFSSSQVANAMSRVDVTTLGGVTRGYPEGPRYTHLINEKDPLLELFDLLTAGQSHLGPNATVQTFSDDGSGGALGAHWPSTYVGHLDYQAPVHAQQDEPRPLRSQLQAQAVRV